MNPIGNTFWGNNVVKLRFVALLGFLVLFAGCATFGIRPASYEDGREGRDYTMLVRAWDKKASDLTVIFTYRVNGGMWRQLPGSFNGTLFEAKVSGQELPAGTLEYYAWMTNAKGEKVNSQPVTILILSFAQAKQKTEQAYRARLGEGGTPSEFFYNETAVFKLRVGSGAAILSAAPESAVCTVVMQDGTKTAQSVAGAAGVYEARIPSPLAGTSCTYQWTVKWRDAEFGDIASVWPESPKIVPILDQAAIKARIEKDFRAALSHRGSVSGTYFQPPVVQARLSYGPTLAKYAVGGPQVNLVIRRGPTASIIKMTESPVGVFSAEVPVNELEAGVVTYSFRYSGLFADIGTVQAEYPVDKPLTIGYRSYAELTKEAIAALQSKFAHQPPTNALEGSPLSFRVDALDPAVAVTSITLDGIGQSPIGKRIAFMPSQGTWYAAIPGAVVRPGTFSYRITAIVRDPLFGDLTVPLPTADAYAVTVKSMAALRAEKEAALAREISHIAPANAVQGKPLALTVTQNPAVSGASATLYFRIAGSARYRELRAQSSSGSFTFTVDAADTAVSYIQYYFTVTAVDPVVGSVTATLKDATAGVQNDFIVTPAKESASAAPSLPAPAPAPAPVPVPEALAAPVPVPTTPGTPTTPVADEPFAPLSCYKGQNDDQTGVRFYVTLKNELGLYDVSVMARIRGQDTEFREYRMSRKGKEYSFTLDTANLPAGTRIDFFYQAYRKGIAVGKISADDGSPFYTVIAASAAIDNGNGKTKKKK